jgi:hypothetical protein
MNVVSMEARGRRSVGQFESGPWWLTVRPQRRVLVMALTMTSVKRLLDIAGLFQGDLRVQLVFTVPPYVLGRGAAEMLAAYGVPLVPWAQATADTFDLAVTTDFAGIAEVDAPVVVFAHGASRNSLARPRGRGSIAVPGPVIGFTRSDLIHSGMLVPGALAVGHERELELLEEGCPEALPIATVVGDPCYDRITSGKALRGAYRAALGLEDGQKLVVATSTWRENSLLGSASHLVEQLVEQLRFPEYRVVLLTHPNIWAVHGDYQMHAWYGRWVHRGLVLAPAESDWQPIVMAADWIVGDHGSVTLYGAAVGVPVLLGAYPERDVHPRSGAAALGALAPRLTTAAPMVEQLADAAAQFDPDAMARTAGLITSEPGGFARHARRLLYAQLGLSQPVTPARLPAAAMPPALCALGLPMVYEGDAA